MSLHAAFTSGGTLPNRKELLEDPLFPRMERTFDQDAIIVPVHGRGDRWHYQRISFRDLQGDVMSIAAGLQRVGVRKGMRIAMLVPYSPDFVALVFAILKTGAQIVLVDPGIGAKNMLQCLAEVRPDGFVAIAKAHLIRWWKRRLFPNSKIHVVVGRGWPGANLRELRQTPVEHFQPVTLEPDDPAAIIFTSGSTGPAKGVEYSRGNFTAQVAQIQNEYHIPPGGIDLACFPLFGLFNATMGVTTVIPNINTNRPATADPSRLVRVIRDLEIDQSFASPVVWNRIARHCAATRTTLPSLQRVFSAGAPVAPRVLSQLSEALSPGALIATPYGATEALPVATIYATEVLTETASQTALGAGICVGRRFPDIQWRVIAISDEALESLEQVVELATGEIGELVVSGTQVTKRYVTQPHENAFHKIRDGDRIWHRMGDVGYLDANERFWFCGRKAHRVPTVHGTMFTICCEAIFNQHPGIYRSALVGVGPKGRQLPVIICEPWPEHWPRHADALQLRTELADLAQRNERTAVIRIGQILLKRKLPVDVRHNAKILREQLAPWAASRLRVGM